jgi:hypothetical protein
MKKIKLLSGSISLALISLLFVSCNKEKPLIEAIVGKWEIQTEQHIYYLQSVKKFESTYFYEAEELAYEFTSGGSIILYVDGDIYGMLTYTLNGSTITIEAGDNDMEWKNVSINDDVLTWSESGTDIVDEVTYDVDIIYTAAKN